MKSIHENEFNVVGISIRTTNKEAIEFGSIQKLWQRLFDEQILLKIPNKMDDSIIALYYDYENDKNGAYNLLVGARVSKLDKIPDGMIHQYVPAARREIFSSEKEGEENYVFNLWQKIWHLEDQGQLNRSYEFDYELYNLAAQKAQVEIHISIE